MIGGMQMTVNEGRFDRVLRVVLGALLVLAWGLGWWTGTWAVVLGIVGIVLILTGLTGFCPLYRAFGISTHPAAGS